MQLYYIPEDKKDDFENTRNLLKSIIQDIRVDEQFTSDKGIELLSEFSRALIGFKSEIFVRWADRTLVHDQSYISFVQMLVSEIDGTCGDYVKPISVYRDLFSIDCTGDNKRKLSPDEWNKINEVVKLESSVIVQALAKRRSFGDIVTIIKILFNIK